MGRFEDLLAQAREGDAEALDALESEFSGSTLRTQAEEGARFREQYQKVLPVARKARLDDLVGKIDEDLRDAGLVVEDFGDFDPESLSLEQVRDKAISKRDAAQASSLAAAQAAGFDSVEEYNEALNTVKEQQAKKRADLEAVGGGVAGGGGAPPDLEGEKSNFDVGQEAFQAAKQAGRSDDIALAQSIEAILDNQSALEE